MDAFDAPCGCGLRRCLTNVVGFIAVNRTQSKRYLLDAIGGLATLITLQANTPATTNGAARYARIVEEHALLRRLCCGLPKFPTVDHRKSPVVERVSAGLI